MGLQAKLRKVQEAAGFVRVFEALRDSGKPAVGHNCFFDLAFTLEHLAEPLPEDWPAFKRLVQKWFPGVTRSAGLPWELECSLARMALSAAVFSWNVKIFMITRPHVVHLLQASEKGALIWLFLWYIQGIPFLKHSYLHLYKIDIGMLYKVSRPQETRRGI